jgi:hypothetical protein
LRSTSLQPRSYHRPQGGAKIPLRDPRMVLMTDTGPRAHSPVYHDPQFPSSCTLALLHHRPLFSVSCISACELSGFDQIYSPYDPGGSSGLSSDAPVTSPTRYRSQGTVCHRFYPYLPRVCQARWEAGHHRQTRPALGFGRSLCCRSSGPCKPLYQLSANIKVILLLISKHPLAHVRSVRQWGHVQ